MILETVWDFLPAIKKSLSQALSLYRHLFEKVWLNKKIYLNFLNSYKNVFCYQCQKTFFRNNNIKTFLCTKKISGFALSVLFLDTICFDKCFPSKSMFFIYFSKKVYKFFNF